MWMGNGFQNGNAYFRVEAPRVSYADGVFDESTNLVKFRNCCWYTNIDHGRRHQPLRLMTMAENYKHSKHKELRGRKDYIHYENYDAIEVPFTDAIPSDYKGVMGVPLTFLDKYCPEQFEILNCNDCRRTEAIARKAHGLIKDKESAINGKPTYVRVLIRRKG